MRIGKGRVSDPQPGMVSCVRPRACKPGRQKGGGVGPKGILTSNYWTKKESEGKLHRRVRREKKSRGYKSAGDGAQKIEVWKNIVKDRWVAGGGGASSWKRQRDERFVRSPRGDRITSLARSGRKGKTCRGRQNRRDLENDITEGRNL